MANSSILSSDWVKNLGVTIPLVASAIAISYDVGFFGGLGIEYFTLFSITEHLVFAMQALPVALIVVVMGAMFLIITIAGEKPLERMVDKFTGRISGLTSDELTAKIRWLGRAHNLLRIVSAVWLIGMAVYGAWSIWRGQLFGELLTICISILVPAYVERQRSAVARSILLLIMPMSVGLSFAVGYEVGRFVLKPSGGSDTINVEGQDVKGRIIRAGDRGILVIRETRILFSIVGMQ